MDINNKLKFLRKQKGISQGEAAQSIGVSLSSYQKYERDKNCVTPSIDVILKIADFYEVTTDYLLGRAPLTNPSLAVKPLDFDEFEKLYKSLPDFAKEILFEAITKLAQAQQTKAKKQAEEKPDIQLHEGQRLAVARTSDPDKLYRPAPTEEQMKSFTPCTPDMLGEDE